MALSFPTVGDNLALEAIVNKTAAQNLTLKLYQNNITPAKTDVAGTYTEATFTGYVSVALTGATWGAAAAASIAYPQQTFTSSANQTAQLVYGYYIIQTTSTIIVYSERFSDGPYSISNNGDVIKVTPTITAN